MSRFQRAMIWLGLTDAEEEDEFEDDFEERPARRARHYRSDGAVVPPSRVQVFQASSDYREDEGNIRHLSPDRTGVRGSPDLPTTRIDAVVQASEPRPSFVKPVPAEKPKLHLSAPQRFSDVQEIGDRFRERQIVLVDTHALSRDLARRVTDFCSGVTYALDGRIEKLSDELLLISPANIELSVNDKDKLMERMKVRIESQ